MSTILRSEFLSQLTGQKLVVADLRADPATSALRIAQCDLDGDGELSTPIELDKLFTELDRLDNDGNRNSMRLGDPGALTNAGKAVDAVKRNAKPTGALRDVALANGFGSTPRLPVQTGSRGANVVALQYALGRLGFLSSPVDGSFGPKTAAAVRGFQASVSLPETGVVDRDTLNALDTAVASQDLRVPAARVAEPLAYLSDFAQFDLSPIVVNDRSRPLNFNHPEIQAAYGQFCSEYWPVMKDNRIECDCKTVGLFLLHQFRAKARLDLGVTLPMPSKNGARLADTAWVASTAQRTGGYFSRFSSLPVIRPGYGAGVAIQSVDPTHSMLYGVNIRQDGLNADAVSRVVQKQAGAVDNHGDTSKPEIAIETLNLGDTIFMDHKGDGKFDHAMTVVGIERGSAGTVSKLTVAIGSFDDMKDANSDTPPRGPSEINQYAEELEITFDDQGRINGSQTTYTSEPAYITGPRYRPSNVLMELRGGGVIFVGRWGNT